MTAWLTGLLASVIRPIIEEEFKLQLNRLEELYKKNQRWNEYDKEVEKYLPALAGASTSEERWALLADLKAHRAKLDL